MTTTPTSTTRMINSRNMDFKTPKAGSENISIQFQDASMNDVDGLLIRKGLHLFNISIILEI